jgi:hypothetical protein
MVRERLSQLIRGRARLISGGAVALLVAIAAASLAGGGAAASPEKAELERQLSQRRRLLSTGVAELPVPTLSRIFAPDQVRSAEELYQAALDMRLLATRTYTLARVFLDQDALALAEAYVEKGDRYFKVSGTLIDGAQQVAEGAISITQWVVTYEAAMAALGYALPVGFGAFGRTVHVAADLVGGYVLDEGLRGTEEATIRLTARAFSKALLEGTGISRFVGEAVSHGWGSSRVFSVVETYVRSEAFKTEMLRVFMSVVGTAGEKEAKRIVEHGLSQIVQSLVRVGLFDGPTAVQRGGVVAPPSAGASEPIATPSARDHTECAAGTRTAIVLAVDGWEMFAGTLGIREYSGYLAKGLKQFDDTKTAASAVEAFAWQGDISQDTRQAVAKLRVTYLPALAARARKEERPFVIVTHSWGSVLVYRAIRELEQQSPGRLDIDMLVTLGSPLGSSRWNAVAHDRARRYLSGLLPLSKPKAVQRWINYWSPADSMISAEIPAADENIELPNVQGSDHSAYYQHPEFVGLIASRIREASPSEEQCDRVLASTLVLDVSGSMEWGSGSVKGKRKIDVALEAARVFAKGGKEDEQVSLHLRAARLSRCRAGGRQWRNSRRCL